VRALAALLLLQSCAAVPHLATVDKGQEHELADHGTVEWFVVDQGKSPCLDERAYACTYEVGDRHRVWIHRDHQGSLNNNETLKRIAEHEFNHVVFGPEHEE